MAVADDQRPLKDKAAAWFDKAKSYIPSAAPPSPIDAGASTVAGLTVERITKANWRRKMLPVTGDPSGGPQEWIVYFSGNTSCDGRCEQADKAFNVTRHRILLCMLGLMLTRSTMQESAAILASTIPPPRLGRVDCDKDNLLCTTWSTGIPELWHFLISIPTSGQPRGPSPLHIMPIHPKNVTSQDMVKIHTQKAYLDQPEYTGAYHPIDGWLQRFRLLEPLGYAMWFMGSTPSWLLMIGISFLSRQLM
jgi:hypothetical protein